MTAACSMRALYGTDGTRNSSHGSDSPTSAAREIKFFFPSLKLDTAAATLDALVSASFAYLVVGLFAFAVTALSPSL